MRWWHGVVIILLLWWIITDPGGAARDVDSIGSFISSVLPKGK
jgi:hypothetical protein